MCHTPRVREVAAAALESRFTRVTWLVCMCHVNRSHVYRDWCACVTHLEFARWLLQRQSRGSYVWRHALICVTWLTHMCDVTDSHVWRILMCNGSHSNVYRDSCTHSYVWRDSFTCVTHLKFVKSLLQRQNRGSHVWRDSCICVTWLIRMCDTIHTHICDTTHSHAWRDSSICVTWLIHVCDETHSHAWHASSLRSRFCSVKIEVHMCDVTHSHAHVWRDSSICVMWLTQMCDVTHSHVWHTSSSRSRCCSVRIDFFTLAILRCGQRAILIHILKSLSWLHSSTYCTSMQCNTLPHTHTAIHRRTLQHSTTHQRAILMHILKKSQFAAFINILQHNTMQYTSSHFNTLPHTANTPHHTSARSWNTFAKVTIRCTQQHTSSHRNTLPHTTTHCHTLPHTATHHNTL